MDREILCGALAILAIIAAGACLLKQEDARKYRKVTNIKRRKK